MSKYDADKCGTCGRAWAEHQGPPDNPEGCSRHPYRPVATVPAPPHLACMNCLGCGQVADTDAAEPWTYWLGIPDAPGTPSPKPVTCPACNGTGQRVATTGYLRVEQGTEAAS